MKNNFWYYKKNSKTHGPNSYFEIRNLILKGEVCSTDLLFCDGRGLWQQAQAWPVFEKSFFPELNSSVSASPNPIFGGAFGIATDGRRDETFKKAFWYYWKNDQVTGPHSFAEMEEVIARGEIGPRDVIYNDCIGSWQPALSWKAFAPELFASARIFFECKEVPQDEKAWVVLSALDEDKTPLQEGPFTTNELVEKIKKRKITLQQYVWRPGMTSWCPIKDVPAF